MAGFVGCWEKVSSENVEAYMDAVNVPAEVRPLMKLKQELTISNEGDKWKFINKYGDKGNEVNLIVGTMCDYKTPTGTPMKGIIKSVGEQIVEEHFIGEAGLKVDTVRQITNGQLCVCATVKGVTAKFVFNKK